MHECQSPNLNSANIIFWLLGGHFTKYNSRQIFWLYGMWLYYKSLMFQWYSSVSKHKFSWGSWVSFLDCSVLCLYLSGEAPPTSCHHGDSLSWVSCLQGSEQMFSVLRVDCEIIRMTHRRCKNLKCMPFAVIMQFK